MVNTFQELDMDSNINDTSKLVSKEEKRLKEILGQLRPIIESLYKYNNEMSSILSPSEMLIYHQYFKDKLLIAKMLVDINNSNFTINEWIGTYLLAAKQEANTIIENAKITSRRIDQHSEPNAISDSSLEENRPTSDSSETSTEPIYKLSSALPINPMDKLARLRMNTDQQYNDVLGYINEN